MHVLFWLIGLKTGFVHEETLDFSKLTDLLQYTNKIVYICSQNVPAIMSCLSESFKDAHNRKVMHELENLANSNGSLKDTKTDYTGNDMNGCTITLRTAQLQLWTGVIELFLSNVDIIRQTKLEKEIKNTLDSIKGSGWLNGDTYFKFNVQSVHAVGDWISDVSFLFHLMKVCMSHKDTDMTDKKYEYRRNETYN